MSTENPTPESRKLAKLAKARAWKAAHPERVRELNKRANKKRISTPELYQKKLEQSRRSNRKWLAKTDYDKTRDPLKVRARNKVRDFIFRGKMQRMPCEVCGKTAQAHHEDYSKPLEVKWLCPKHHAELHK